MTRRRLLALVATAAVLGGCGGSGYEYVANREEGVYFKVPEGWEVFDTEDLLEPDEAEGRWVRGFDAAEVPSPDRVFVVASATPRGFAEIRPLSQAERQRVSLTSLRATGFGTSPDGTPIDPIAYAEENPDELEILGYEELVLDGGRGVRLRFAAEAQDGETVVLDQIVLVDDGTSKRFLFSVGCTDACWDVHGDEMEEVVESWTMEVTS